MVLKTTFGQSQRWSLISGTKCVENVDKKNFNFTKKVFNGHDVSTLGGLNSGISLYLCFLYVLLTWAWLVLAYLVFSARGGGTSVRSRGQTEMH